MGRGGIERLSQGRPIGSPPFLISDGAGGDANDLNPHSIVEGGDSTVAGAPAIGIRCRRRYRSRCYGNRAARSGRQSAVVSGLREATALTIATLPPPATTAARRIVAAITFTFDPSSSRELFEWPKWPRCFTVAVLIARCRRLHRSHRLNEQELETSQSTAFASLAADGRIWPPTAATDFASGSRSPGSIAAVRFVRRCQKWIRLRRIPAAADIAATRLRDRFAAKARDGAHGPAQGQSQNHRVAFVPRAWRLGARGGGGVARTGER